MSKRKVINGVIVLLIASVFFIVIYSSFVFRTINPIKAFNIWRNVAIDNDDIYLIQEGEYGGSGSEKVYGFVFSNYDNTPVEALDKIGFHDIGHTYFDGSQEHPEYCTGECGIHAIIEGRVFYLGGYLLKYRVVGVA